MSLFPKIDTNIERFTAGMFVPKVHKIFFESVTLTMIDKDDNTTIYTISVSDSDGKVRILHNEITSLTAAVDIANDLLTNGYYNSSPQNPPQQVTLKVPPRSRTSPDPDHFGYRN